MDDGGSREENGWKGLIRLYHSECIEFAFPFSLCSFAIASLNSLISLLLWLLLFSYFAVGVSFFFLIFFFVFPELSSSKTHPFLPWRDLSALHLQSLAQSPSQSARRALLS